MDANFHIVRRIMLATNKIDGVYYLFGKRLGVNENTLAFFYAMADGQPHSQKEISDQWLIPRTTINSIVKAMLAEGYIQFCPDQHAKEKELVLTDKGNGYKDKVLTDIYATEERAIAQTLQQYPPEFVEALECFSEGLREAFEAMGRS